jgi:putative intracellular protease/amidase
MKNRTCALFLFDGFADWEPALAVAGLNQYSDFAIQPFSITGQMVTSAGGLQIQPQKALSEMQAGAIDLLIIPGGNAWEADTKALAEIEPLVQTLIDRRTPVAAICGATILLARMGILDRVAHTSNGPGYLSQHCPAYQGAAFFQHQPCVSTDGIITANGAAMIEFAHEIYQTCQVMDADTLESVKELYKSGGMVNRFHEQAGQS